jgi:hypothetical protein
MVLVIILLIQTSGSIFGFGKTFYDKPPYSNAQTVALFINEICDRQCTLVAENDMSASALTAFMPGRKIFYFNRSEFGTFASWKINEFGKYSDGWDDLVADVRSFKKIIFIFPTDTNVLIPENYNKKVFADSVWGDDYILAWE